MVLLIIKKKITSFLLANIIKMRLLNFFNLKWFELALKRQIFFLKNIKWFLYPRHFYVNSILVFYPIFSSFSYCTDTVLILFSFSLNLHQPIPLLTPISFVITLTQNWDRFILNRYNNFSPSLIRLNFSQHFKTTAFFCLEFKSLLQPPTFIVDFLENNLQDSQACS